MTTDVLVAARCALRAGSTCAAKVEPVDDAARVAAE